ncbi:hypothetical protein F5148DRAFT_986718 [Russula earlei]|uniref:Uncharacterized protein n=1 Tax=Russula earlei TaxID=71964 RepID=A0ACC0TX62_9AGAM|nr:hypothetical protein F5148DRAFT_986718 [Russula earlei]
MKERRASHQEQLAKGAPSTLGDPTLFRKSQEKEKPSFSFERPLSASHDVPPTLLHPIFGQFVDDCQQHNPTREDNMFAFDLRAAMSQIWGKEDDRRDAFILIMRKHGIELGPTVLSTKQGSYRTDADSQEQGYRYIIVEAKNEIGSGGPEPLFQAIWYYQRSLEQIVDLERKEMRMLKYDDSSLPCLIIYLFGAHIGFAAAAYSSMAHIQVLSTPLPLFYHRSDTHLQLTVARHMGAFKKAAIALQAACKIEFAPNRRKSATKTPVRPTSPPPEEIIFPYREHFKDLSDDSQAECHFTYIRKIKQRLVFEAELANGGKRVCVKFVRRYSKEAHEQCVKLQCAPNLLGFECLPGGWIMVVMDYLDGDQYSDFVRLEQTDNRNLMEAMKGALDKLHQAGFAHGDVRDVNTMVNNNNPSEFMLVDFDWAGKIEEVRYPPNVNRDDIWRPDGVIDGEMILPQHDMEMLRVMFEKISPDPHS